MLLEQCTVAPLCRGADDLYHCLHVSGVFKGVIGPWFSFGKYNFFCHNKYIGKLGPLWVLNNTGQQKYVPSYEILNTASAKNSSVSSKY